MSVIFQTKAKTARSIFGKNTTEKLTKWDHIITAIRARQYRRAIKGLYNATKGSKRSFIEVVATEIRKEVSELLKHPDTFSLGKTVSRLNFHGTRPLIL